MTHTIKVSVSVTDKQKDALVNGATRRHFNIWDEIQSWVSGGPWFEMHVTAPTLESLKDKTIHLLNGLVPEQIDIIVLKHQGKSLAIGNDGANLSFAGEFSNWFKEQEIGVRRYQKKPVVVEAIQYTGENASLVIAWSEGLVNHVYASRSSLDDVPLCIKTLEGELTVSPTDYIIRGVKGEYYPVRQDIFEETYQEVKDETNS